jgi:hypothetical protein
LPHKGSPELIRRARFHARAIVDEDGLFEAAQAVVPAHLFRTHLPSAVEFASSFKISPEDRQVVIKLLDLLFDEGDHLSRSASEYLVHAFLETISEYISHVSDGQVLRMKVGDKRLADIQNLLWLHSKEVSIAESGCITSRTLELN